MERSSHAQRALALLHKQGFLRTRDLDTIGAPRVVLTRLSTSGQLERVGRGLYRLPGNPMSEKEDLASIAVKVPKAVFCLLTALQFHELTPRNCLARFGLPCLVAATPHVSSTRRSRW
jgi:predicted transcriptional regulator of viral defense system